MPKQKRMKRIGDTGRAWITSGGQRVAYKDISNLHLRNIIKWIEIKAEWGMKVEYGGGGWDADDCWYEEETIAGDEVLEKYDYEGLLTELKRRGLKKYEKIYSFNE